MGHIVVDAMNVIGSRPTGWWRDRDGAVRGLLGRLQRLAREGGGEVSVFVDGRPLGDVPEGEHDGVAVYYAARRGPNAADDRIVDFVRAHDEPASLAVVTSDRTLADRVGRLGATVRGARWLLERLDAVEAAEAAVTPEPHTPAKAAPAAKRRRKHGAW